MRKFFGTFAVVALTAFMAVPVSFAAETPKADPMAAFLPTTTQPGVPSGIQLPAPEKAATQAGAPVYLVQTVPGQVAPAPGPLDTFLNLLPTILLVLGTVLAGVFKLVGGQKADYIKRTVADVATAAWYVAERQGGSTAQKASTALANFHQGLTGQGIPLSQCVDAQAATIWKGMSAAEGVTRAKAQQAMAAAQDPSQAPAQK